ncbi:MAG: hypothetical protein A2003_03095 [Acinetobacter sp. GWC1_38_13]|uniref:hypothetical protein n=1 Tax=Acinetobacter sp. GWC1_38_13 TaxID=1797234 RepID=UPI0008CDDF04|nr:hypothetical protein [Acinetobacter sp. GWC1_38_13]OFW45023.1 MAG: hypothetical protein A2003_03095 [Acinetobacter sp. GWC1_38_13]HAV57166.1 hypothetical protein [Acinetobacter junii]
MDYNNNPAGAKQYVLDQINNIDEYFGSDIDVHFFRYYEALGSLKAYFAVGLIDIFEYDQLLINIALASNRFMQRITSLQEQI